MKTGLIGAFILITLMLLNDMREYKPNDFTVSTRSNFAEHSEVFTQKYNSCRSLIVVPESDCRNVAMRHADTLAKRFYNYGSYN